MDSSKEWIEVQNEPGYVYCPDDIEINEDGVCYVIPVFDEKLARDKYEMSDSEIIKQSQKVLTVKINRQEHK